jgi:hypothetical protein
MPNTMAGYIAILLDAFLSLHHLDLLLLVHLMHQGRGMTVTLQKMEVYMINYKLFVSILLELQ